MSIVIPHIDPDADTLTAALAYAAAGLYVGPVKCRTKHPGSVLGGGWQALTSRDPEVIASWFAGTDHGVFLHAGRSGLIVADVDTPENLHPDVKRAITELSPPFQTSRVGHALRGHYLFAMPQGRTLGNSLGGLASGWGELRGHNGVIIVAPSEHEHAPEDGLYRWQRVGPVPEFPAYCAAQVGDAMPSEAAASDAEVAAFLDAHTEDERPSLIGIHVTAFQTAVTGGESRHQSMTGHLAGAMREAAAGLVDARTAADTLESVFLVAVTAPPAGPKQGEARGRAQARTEWRGLLSWAVAQAEGSDPAETRARVTERVPDEEALVRALVAPRAESGTPATPVAPEVDAGKPQDEPGSSWAALDLSDVIDGVLAGTITRPAPTIGRRTDGQALFYRGRVNGVAGSSNAGKSWTGFHTCAQEITAGEHVVYVDLEDDMHGAVTRLLDLGADPEAIRARFHYVRPAEAFGILAAARFGQLLDQVRPSVVVIDSTGESLALEGGKPNDDDDVARWFRKMPTAITRRCGAAVLVLDHVTKADDGGLWPIGSQRKRAAITGAQYMQTVVRPFDRTTPGFSKLVCAKDRHGHFHQGQTVALLHVTPGSSGVALELGVPQETGSSGVGTWRPTAIMEKVSRLLEDADEPLGVRAIERGVTGKKEHKTQATEYLVAAGHVTTEPGPNRSILHKLVTPYRQADDPRSDMFRGSGDTHLAEVPPDGCVGVPVPREGDGGHTPRVSPGDTGGTPGDTTADGAVMTRRPLPTADDGSPLPCPDCGRKPHHVVGCTWGQP